MAVRRMAPSKTASAKQTAKTTATAKAHPWDSCPSCSKIFSKSMDHVFTYAPMMVLQQTASPESNERLKYCFQHLSHFEDDLVDMWAVFMKTAMPNSANVKAYYSAGIQHGLYWLVNNPAFRGRPYFACYALSALVDMFAHRPEDLDLRKPFHQLGLLDALIYYIQHGLTMEQFFAWRVLAKMGDIDAKYTADQFAKVFDAWKPIAVSAAPRAQKFVMELGAPASAWQTDVVRPMLPVEEAKRYAPRLASLTREAAFESILDLHKFIDPEERFRSLQLLTQPGGWIVPLLVQNIVTPPPAYHPETTIAVYSAELLERLFFRPGLYRFKPNTLLGDYFDSLFDSDPLIVKHLVDHLLVILSPDYGPRGLKHLAEVMKHVPNDCDVLAVSEREKHVYIFMANALLASIATILWEMASFPRALTYFRNEKGYLDTVVQRTLTLTFAALPERKQLKDGWLTVVNERSKYRAATPVLQLYARLVRLKVLSDLNMKQTETYARSQLVQYKDQGNNEYRNKRFAPAMQFYNMAIDTLECLPNNAAELSILHGNRSQAFYMLGSYHEAEADARLALRLDPSNDKNLVRLQRAKEAVDRQAAPCPPYLADTLKELRDEDEVPPLV